MSEQQKIAGVLVTYNPDISIFLSAIEQCSQQIETLYVIDNFSDNRASIIKSITNFSNIKLISLSSNQGLAAAQNIAIEKITESDFYTHIILFDQDSVITNGFINALIVDCMELERKGNKVGAIGPSFYDPVNNESYPATLYRGPFISRITLTDEPIAATYIIASGCLFSINVLRDVGFMKAELFIDYIDVEWSLRARSKGYKVYITPNARMAHTIGDARKNVLGRNISVHSPFRRYFLIRNSFLMMRLDYIPLGYKIRELMFNILRFTVALIHSKEKKKVVKYSFYGLLDGLKGVSGPFSHIQKGK